METAKGDLANKVLSAQSKKEALQKELNNLLLNQAKGYPKSESSPQQVNELGATYREEIRQKEELYKQSGSELRKLERQIAQFDSDLKNIHEILNPAD